MTDDAARPRLAGAASSLVSPTADQTLEGLGSAAICTMRPPGFRHPETEASLLMQTPFKKGGYSPKMVRV